MTLVILLVNVFKSPTTLLENVCTPVTIEAAMSAPGRADEPRPDEDGNEVVEAVVGAGRYVGS